MEMIIRTENVTKEYKGINVVNCVNINAAPNQIYGLLGPNGAGKSTLLKMISGIARPTSGKLYFDGHEWSRLDLKNIGALIENPAIYGNLSAYENMELRTLLLGIGKERIDETLSIVGLQGLGKKKTRQFSLGMKQRLGIAMSIIGKPKLLILDEPMNGLDPFGIDEIREMIRGFARSGMAVILSSHILSEIEMLADRIGILSEGELVYECDNDRSGNLEEMFMKIAKNRREQK